LTFEDLEPRRGRDDVLTALTRQDLDVYAVEELSERIAILEAEIARCRAAIEAKRSKKSAADALFSFRT